MSWAEWALIVIMLGPAGPYPSRAASMQGPVEVYPDRGACELRLERVTATPVPKGYVRSVWCLPVVKRER